MCTYKFYDWCYFRDGAAKFPFNKEILGRVLGPAKGEGNEMAQWILKLNGKVIPSRTNCPLHIDEIHNPQEVKKREVFDALIERRYGTSTRPAKDIKDESESDDEEYEEYQDDDEDKRVVPDIEDITDSTGKIFNQQPYYDQLVNVEVSLQHEDFLQVGKVRKRAVGPDRPMHGKYHDNPRLNSLLYEFEFPDGQVKEYAANVIAQNILDQCDSEGYKTAIFDSIIDYKKTDAATLMENKFITTKSGQQHIVKTTKGWKLLVRLNDMSEKLVPLKHLKESNPVDVAEFAVARGIQDEPAFAW